MIKKRPTATFIPYTPLFLSVIQGVALADLALVVGAGYQQFTVVRWLLVLVNFGMVITVWHQFTMHITLWSWIPDLRDAIIVFIIGAVELVFNHTISLSLSAWLFIVAIFAIMAILAIWYVSQRAKEEGDRESVVKVLWGQHGVFELAAIGGSALYLLLAVVSRVESLE